MRQRRPVRLRCRPRRAGASCPAASVRDGGPRRLRQDRRRSFGARRDRRADGPLQRRGPISTARTATRGAALRPQGRARSHRGCAGVHRHKSRLLRLVLRLRGRARGNGGGLLGRDLQALGRGLERFCGLGRGDPGRSGPLRRGRRCLGHGGVDLLDELVTPEGIRCPCGGRSYEPAGDRACQDPRAREASLASRSGRNNAITVHWTDELDVSVQSPVDSSNPRAHLSTPVRNRFCRSQYGRSDRVTNSQTMESTKMSVTLTELETSSACRGAPIEAPRGAAVPSRSPAFPIALPSELAALIPAPTTPAAPTREAACSRWPARAPNACFTCLVCAARELPIAAFVCEMGPSFPGLLIRTITM